MSERFVHSAVMAMLIIKKIYIRLQYLLILNTIIPTFHQHVMLKINSVCGNSKLDILMLQFISKAIKCQCFQPYKVEVIYFF